MTYKKQIVVDCDGVLLDPILGFIKWVVFNFPNINIAKVLIRNSAFVDECILSFWKSSDFSEIPAINEAKDSIKFLKEYYDIDIITNCGEDVRASRIKNLEKHFGKDTFKNIYTLPFHSSKKDIYNLYEHAIVIDDELPNIIDAENSLKNHKVFWMSYYPLFKKIAYNKYDNLLEKQYKKTSWNNIISYIKNNNLMK